MRSSGSPGQLAAVGGWLPVPAFTLRLQHETSNDFPETNNY